MWNHTNIMFGSSGGYIAYNGCLWYVCCAYMKAHLDPPKCIFVQVGDLEKNVTSEKATLLWYSPNSLPMNDAKGFKSTRIMFSKGNSGMWDVLAASLQRETKRPVTITSNNSVKSNWDVHIHVLGATTPLVILRYVGLLEVLLKSTHQSGHWIFIPKTTFCCTHYPN